MPRLHEARHPQTCHVPLYNVNTLIDLAVFFQVPELPLVGQIITSKGGQWKAPSFEIDRRRNFAIISHPDAGKTTLTEKLLLYGGAIQEVCASRAYVPQVFEGDYCSCSSCQRRDNVCYGR